MIVKQLKKIVTVILIFSLLITVSGCSKSQIEKAQDKIVSIGEQFLNYELTADDAHKQLESIAIPTTEGNGGTYLTADKGHLEFLIISTKNNPNIFGKIEEHIQSIKDYDYK